MTDPDIIEAAARAVQRKSDYVLSNETAERIACAVLAAVTPLILERAAKVAEDYTVPCPPQAPPEIDGNVGQRIAAAIRALKEQP